MLFKDAKGNLVEADTPLGEVVQFHPQGGGFVYSVPKAKFEALFTPADMSQVSTMRKVRVTGDWMEDGTCVEAFTNDMCWNGWAIPYFTLENAKLVVASSPDITFDEKLDAFIWSPAESEDEPEVFAAQVIDFAGNPVKVYGIGCGSWTWEIARPAVAESDTPAQEARPRSQPE